MHAKGKMVFLAVCLLSISVAVGLHKNKPHDESHCIL